jgi:hypothetical protein
VHAEHGDGNGDGHGDDTHHVLLLALTPSLEAV